MKKKIISVLFYVIAIFYIFLMLDLFIRFRFIFVTNRLMVRSYNLIPFYTVREYLFDNLELSKSTIIQNLVGNIALFIPYGMYIQVLRHNKRFGSNLLIVLLTSAAIEIIQFVFAVGACDIDDIILNFAGGLIGVLGFKILHGVFKDYEKARTTFTVLSAAVGLPIMIFWIITFIYNW